MSKQRISFKGIGEEGVCDKCGKELLNTYHFVIDGEHIQLGSSCAQQAVWFIDNKLDIKKINNSNKILVEYKKDLVRVEYSLSLGSLWFLSDDENKENNEKMKNEIKKLKELITNIENELLC